VTARPIIVALPVVAIVCAVLAWLASGEGPAGGDAGKAPRQPGTIERPGSATALGAGAASESGDAAVDAAATIRTESTATRGTVFCSVNEVDMCIDPVGTTLILRNERTGDEQRSVIDSNANAMFEDVELPGAYELRTAVADRRMFPARFDLEPAQFDGTPPSTSLSVSLVHVHDLSGVVRDATTRQPIAGAVVEMDSFFVSRSETDKGGRYELNLPEPRGTVIVHAPGYQEFLWRYPETTARGGTWLPDERDFELLPDMVTSWIDVAAFRVDGSPAAGAALDVVELQSFGIADEDLAGLGAQQGAEFLMELNATFDGFGRVEGVADPVLQNLDEYGRGTLIVRVPGRLRIMVRDGPELAAVEVDVNAGQRTNIEMHLEPSIKLHIEAVHRGEAVSGVEVFAEVDGVDRHRAITTDTRGRVALTRLLPGSEVVLHVNGRGWWCSPVLIHMAKDSSVVLEVLRAGHPHQVEVGVVDGRSGQPIESAEFFLSDFIPWQYTEIEPGRYRLRSFVDRSITVRHPRYLSKLWLWNGRDAFPPAIRLDPIEESVSAELSGALDVGAFGVPRGRVVWLPEFGPAQYADADSDGSFMFDEARVGRGTLLVEAGLRGAAIGLVLPTTGLNGVVVRLVPVREIPVRVVDAELGVPVDQVTMRPAPVRGHRFVHYVGLPASSNLPLKIDAAGYESTTVVLKDRALAEVVVIPLRPIR